MRFSKTSEYAIRVLSYLKLNSEDLHSALSLHKRLNIPYKYLTRILTDLEKKGLVLSLRGRNGGFRLAKKPSDIKLKDILEATGENTDTSRCILGFETCDDSNPCLLHDRWLEAKKDLEKMINETSLEDFTNYKDNIQIKI